jgi:hypothetical protein
VRLFVKIALGLSIILTVLALMPSVAAAPIASANDIPGLQVEEIDPRYQQLNIWFDKYKCPEPRYVQEYIEAADKNGIDYRLLPAISLQESTCGQHVPHWCPKGTLSNNWWGFRAQCYKSVADGIDSVLNQMANTAPFAGNTVKKMLWYYNGTVNPTYPGSVMIKMKEIEASKI